MTQVSTEHDWSKPESMTSEKMMSWRLNEAESYKNLLRNCNQILFMHKHKPLDKRRCIVDYGCAFGDLLMITKVLNPEHDLYGIEYVRGISQNTEKILGEKRIFIQSCEVKTPLKPNSVDIICSFDMIEHVSKQKVNLMLKECDRILKKDGVCLIVTPNCNWMMKIIYRLTGNGYILDSKGHPNQYNALTLKDEISKGLDIIKVEKGYDLNFFTKILSWFGIYRHICIIASKKIKTN